MTTDLQPTLTGELLYLRPLDQDDFENLYAVAADPLIWQQLPQSNRHEREVFKNIFAESLSSKGALLVIDKKTNEVIGSSRYYDLDIKNKTVAIGYTYLARKCWGHTFNKEMKKLMIEHAFGFVDKIFFHVAECNIRSQKAIERIGAKVIEKVERQFTGGAKAMYLTYEIKKDES